MWCGLCVHEENPIVSDAVDHPSHYNSGKIEVIDAIEDWNLGFHLGNVVKYIAIAAQGHANRGFEEGEVVPGSVH